jgi:hypothetical protein
MCKDKRPESNTSNTSNKVLVLIGPGAKKAVDGQMNITVRIKILNHLLEE